MAKRKRCSSRRPIESASLAETSAVRRWQVAACLAIVATAVCLADGRIVQNDWVSWDDHDTIYRNPAFNPPEFGKLLRFWREPHKHLYIPVTYTFWWLVAEASWSPSGSNPAAFHAASVALHIVAAWLVLAIGWRLVGSLAAATAGALLFALHPVQVETVAWASGAKDLLAGVFSLLALWLFLGRCRAATARGRRCWIGLATLAYCLALFAKPSAVVVPLVLLAVGWLSERRFSQELLTTCGIWLALALPVVVLTRLVQPAIGVPVLPLWQRPIIALDALGFYLRSLVWPARLTFVYGRTPELQLAWPWFNVAVALAAGLVFAWASRRWPYVAGAAAIWLAALIPYLGLTPFDFQDKSTVADHYLYFAMLGPALALAFAMRLGTKAAWAVCAAVLAVLAVVSYRQTSVWRDQMALLDHAVAMNPQHAAPHHARGVVLGSLGEAADAEREFRTAIRLSPQHAEAHTSLAQLLTGEGRHREALEHYHRAVEAAPRDALKKNNLAVGLVALGRVDDAIAVLREALEGDDRSQDDLLHGNLGRLLLARGAHEEARIELEKALAINPDLDIAQRGLEQLQSLGEGAAQPETGAPRNTK